MADSQLQRPIDPWNSLGAVLKQQKASDNRISIKDCMTNSELLALQWFVGVHSDLPRLLNNVIGAFRVFRDPRHIYQSMLPFLPPSSPIIVHYSKLSDPIRVLRVRSRNKVHVLPEVPSPPNNAPRRGDPPISAITCTALSEDGHRVARGFHDGVVEVVDTELGTTISRFSDGLPGPPVWLLFINGGRKLVTETSGGDIYILDNFAFHRQRFASRIEGSTMVVASLSHDGSMIVRAAEHSTKEWYADMYIFHITTDSPTIHSLSTPSHIIPYRGMGRRFPLQRSVGFSPDGKNVAAFDTQQAFVWSCASFQLIAHYSIKDPRNWFLNTARPSTTPPLALPNDVIVTSLPEHSESIASTSCTLFNVGSGLGLRHSFRIGMRALSLAAAAAPVLGSWNSVWFRGHLITTIPDAYCISKWRSVKLESPRLEGPANFSLPTSLNGTRFLLHDEESCLLVDISGVISDCTT